MPQNNESHNWKQKYFLYFISVIVILLAFLFVKLLPFFPHFLSTQTTDQKDYSIHERHDNVNSDSDFEVKCIIGRGQPPSLNPNYSHSIDRIQGLPEPDWFYDNYVRPGKPVIIENGMKDWKALELWLNDSYLESLIGNEYVKVERSYDESFGWLADEKVQWSFHNMTFSQFLKVYLTPKPNNPTEKWEHWYLDSGLPTALEKDIIKPNYIPCLNDNNPPFHRYYNIWMGGGEENSLLHNDLEDNLLHLVTGYKMFTLIDPRTPHQWLYEVYDHKITETKLSPVNVRDPNVLEKYPLFANVKPIQFLLKPGEILFIPALYWHQVNSYCRHIAVNVWFDTHGIYSFLQYVYHHPTALCFDKLQKRAPLCPQWRSRYFQRQQSLRTRTS